MGRLHCGLLHPLRASWQCSDGLPAVFLLCRGPRQSGAGARMPCIRFLRPTSGDLRITFRLVNLLWLEIGLHSFLSKSPRPSIDFYIQICIALYSDWPARSRHSTSQTSRRARGTKLDGLQQIDFRRISIENMAGTCPFASKQSVGIYTQIPTASSSDVPSAASATANADLTIHIAHR